MNKAKGLGRGLSALLSDADQTGGTGLVMLPVGEIQPNHLQPRRDFNETELSDLAASIRAKGILQPLAVRRVNGGWELIAGERRLRAARIVGLTEVPCRVLEAADDADLLELSLVENLQREDLNPMELAEGYRALQENWGLSQEQIAAAVGRDRATVANMLRLLNLPEPVRASLRKGEISTGHAKVILMLEGAARQSALWKKVVSGALSVRQTEGIVRASHGARTVRAKPKRSAASDQFAERLQRLFGTKVNIVKRGKKGSIRLEFYSEEDFERLLDLLLKLG